MRKVCKVTIVLVLVIFSSLFFVPSINVLASNSNIGEGRQYIIFDESGNILLEKMDVFVGDYYITKDYKKYEIISIDEELGIGTAKFIKNVDKPKVSINTNPQPIAGNSDKIICLYMTHNDESYVPTDGVDSVYGKGGIHDVALRFANALGNEGVTTYIDETLHIPHDNNAYSRSAVTCKNMLNKYSPNAIFDIHRDGTSRAYYITNMNGKEESMIRIVVGKANSNMEINEEFAIYLMAVADEVAPGLFKDIYYAKGHYNQGQYEKSLLFEMGSHMVEKELVLESADKLAKVVNTALFNTTIDSDNGDLVINDVPQKGTQTIDTALEEKIEQTNNNYTTNILVRFLIWFAVLAGVVWFVIKVTRVKQKRKE